MGTQAIEIQPDTLICYIITSSTLTCHCRAMPKATEIPLKECSAYRQVDQGGSEKEESCIYEHPQ